MRIDFSWQFGEKLAPVFDFKGRYIVLKGGRASGKSHFVARKTLEDRLYKKRDLLCVREFQANLEQSNYKLYRILIEKHNLPFKIYSDFFRSELTKSEIVFRGMNDLTADGIKSYEGFADAWIEEAQKFTLNSFKKLDPTIRQEDSQIFITMNPEFPKDPVLSEIEKSYKEDALILHVNYFDNPFCPEPMKKMAELTKINRPGDYKHIWLGKPRDAAQNNVVKNFSSENIVDINYIDDAVLHISCDFNVDPMCWVIAHKTDDKVFFFDEIVVENTTTVDCVDEFYRRYPNHKAQIIINGDASGDNRSCTSEYTNYVLIKNRLRDWGYTDVEFRLKHFNPPVKNRIASWNEKIKTLEGKREILISPKCKWLIYNCENLKYKEGSSKIDVPTFHQIKQNKELKFLSHSFDAASYLVDFYFGIKLK
ncbi:MAG: PBSX family phage terminase large subunit [Candidatus Gastranaerophilales bacterium]|nr:PBSX family phage terminase large subunit [Candidatus Gastranaerophilales bacterium]